MFENFFNILVEYSFLIAKYIIHYDDWFQLIGYQIDLRGSFWATFSRAEIRSNYPTEAKCLSSTARLYT